MPRKIDPAKAELIKNVLEARKAGLTYAQIGEAFNISPQTAHNYVKKYVEQCIKPASEELYTIELERLDKYLAALEPFVDKGSARHVEIALKVSERRAKLLGIDAPEKSEMTVEHHVKTQAEIELEAMLQEAYGLNRAQKMLEGSSPQNQEASSDA